jgi:hypothetical protein
MQFKTAVSEFIIIVYRIKCTEETSNPRLQGSEVSMLKRDIAYHSVPIDKTPAEIISCPTSRFTLSRPTWVLSTGTPLPRHVAMSERGNVSPMRPSLPSDPHRTSTYKNPLSLSHLICFHTQAPTHSQLL